MEEMTSEKLQPADKTALTTNKIVGGLLFGVFGCMGFFYSIWRWNWNSAAWCLLLEVACALLLHITRSSVQGNLHITYSARWFKIMKYLTAMMTVLSFCAVIVYIALGITYKEEFEVRSHYAAAPIGFLAGFWFAVLCFDCRNYERMLE